MDKKHAREIVEALPSLYPTMTAEEEEAIWTLLATDLDDSIIALEAEHKKLLELQKALKNVPDTNVGDTISRQAAIDAAMECGKKIPPYAIRVKKAIEQLPPAQPQRTGKWILDRSGAYCCSECLEPCAGYVMMKPRDKFCKMCGAKMELA